MPNALYNTSIYAYQTLLRLAAPFHPKARQWVKGREHWAATLQQKLTGKASPVAWFHAASLGEFEQGRPVIEAFRATYPDYKIVLTFFSPSGYEVRKNYAGADVIAYLPADTPANARQFLDLVRPQIAFFIKYEFWANYLTELRQRNVPTLLFSAIFRPNQLFFKPYGVGPAHRFYRGLLRCFSHIFVQNEESTTLLRSVGVTNVTQAGDTRFDRVMDVVRAKKDIPVAREFVGNVPTLVIGSAWAADMDVLIPFLNEFQKPLKVIIAPHEIHEEEIRRWQSQLNHPSTTYSMSERAKERKSEIDEKHSFALSPLHRPAARSLFIDNVGMLSSLYQYGQFAYIGGAFGRGLHNTLEAATFGLPLFFGPNYAKFQEAVDLVAEGGAFPITDTATFRQAFTTLYDDVAARQRAGNVAQQYVQRNTGATAEVMRVVGKLIVKQ